MTEPRYRKLPELTQDAEAATSLFQERRHDEPLQLYSEFIESFKQVFDVLSINFRHPRRILSIPTLYPA